MIPILRRLENVDFSDPRTAVRQLAEHIQDLENQIENLMMNLDSTNFLPIDLDDLMLYTERGTEISGDRIKIVSPTGECFEVGYNKEKKVFVFNLPEGIDITAGNIKATSITATDITATDITGDNIIANEKLKCRGYNAVVE